MPTEATRAFGIQFKMGDGGGPEVFTALAEVTDITPNPLIQETQDATHHGSEQAFREFIPTVKDAGEVSGTMNWIPGHATQNTTTGLASLLLDGEVHNFQVVIPAVVPVTWSFRGIVTNFAPQAAPVDGKLSADFTIKLTGVPTLV